MRRQGVAVGAGAVALCLGGLLAVSGDGGDGKGFVAVGAAGAGPEGAPTKAVPPEGSVELFPLDPNTRGGGGGSRPSTEDPPGTSPDASGARPGSTGTTTPGASGADGPGTRTPGRASGGGPTGTPAGPVPSGPGSRPSDAAGPPPARPKPQKPPTTRPKPPASPAALSVGAPVRAKADRRWCEKVTVRLRNSGGTAVRSGSVTFATHIIGALGIDWGTRTSTQPLPGRIDPGEARNATYTVCVDAWRVPLGMHVETRGVTAAWK